MLKVGDELWQWVTVRGWLLSHVNFTDNAFKKKKKFFFLLVGNLCSCIFLKFFLLYFNYVCIFESNTTLL